MSDAWIKAAAKLVAEADAEGDHEQAERILKAATARADREGRAAWQADQQSG